MGTFLIQLGTMSLQASTAIIVVLVLRKIFAMMQISKKYVMLLWVIPFLLLICPWKISSPVGLWNSAPSDYNTEYAKHTIERIAGEFVQGESSKMESVPDGDQISEGIYHSEADEEYNLVPADTQMLWNVMTVVGAIWLTGMLALLLYATISYLRLRKKVQCCVQRADNLYYVDELQVPMVVGFVKSKIYLPSGMAEEHISYVVEHENTHIRRKDPVTKLIAYVIICVHWFNPLVWLAYHLLEKDMEMTCDEETIQRIGTERKKEYATALLQLSVGTRGMFAMPLAFGEGDTKGRIQNVMHYKKTVKSAAILAVAAGLLVLAVFMTKGEHTPAVTDDTENVAGTENTEAMPAETESEIQAALQEELEKVQEEQERLEQEILELEAQSVLQGGLTFGMVRVAFFNQTVEELDFHSYTNGEEKRFDDDGVLNYYINFDYEYEGEKYRLGVSCQKETDEVTDIYITRISDNEQAWIYTVDLSYSDTNYPNDLETFLNTKIAIEDWLSVDLPEGYTLEEYQGNMGIAGGALISPQAYEVYGDDVFAPQEWYYAGFVGRIPYAADYFTFENGQLVGGQLGFWNHTSYEKLGVLDLDWQAIFRAYNHDLYTAAGVGWLEEDGIDTAQIDTTSDYWYFFFAKEGEEDAYYLSLSAKLFTKEEAIAIAETVDIKE